jgi:hypothetical protein
LISTALKKLAKRGEVHISEGWICRGIYIDQRTVELLKVHHTPKKLAVMFSILMDIVRESGTLYMGTIYVFRRGVKTSLREYPEIGVAYEPRDICDAVLALAVFMYLKHKDEEIGYPGLPDEVYLALPEATVADLLLSRVYFETREEACAAKCFNWLYERGRPNHLTDIVLISGEERGGYSPASVLASHVEVPRDISYYSKVLEVASRYTVNNVERCIFEIRRERLFLAEAGLCSRDMPHNCIFDSGGCRRCRVYCLPDSVELEYGIFTNFVEICRMLNAYGDPKRRLLWLSNYLRIKPREASKPIEF